MYARKTEKTLVKQRVKLVQWAIGMTVTVLVGLFFPKVSFSAPIIDVPAIQKGAGQIRNEAVQTQQSVQGLGSPQGQYPYSNYNNQQPMVIIKDNNGQPKKVKPRPQQPYRGMGY